MPTSRTRNRLPELTERDRAWLAHHRAWLASGHTAKQYAALHGLSLTAFYQARYRLRQRGVGEAVGKRRRTAPASRTSAFVPIGTVRTAAPVDAAEARYQARFPNGMTMSWQGRVVPRDLEATLRAVWSLG